MADEGQIRVMPMRQQLHELHGEDDDWTGVTDPKERRKRQNRLHARAWRKRKAARQHDGGRQDIEASSAAWRRYSARNLSATASSSATSFAEPGCRFRSSTPSSSQSDSASVVRYAVNDYHQSSSPTTSAIQSTNSRLISPLIPYLSEHLSTSTAPISTLTITFPLSPDHHLLTLMQYNVLRATMTNLTILSLLDNISIECSPAREVVAILPVPDSVPPNFRPTPLQRSVRHRFWVDAIPIPEMRDNLISLQDSYDEDEFCVDLCGGLYEGFDEIELRGLLVWGDPWRPDAWEVTEGFAKKWGFLLRGCVSLIEATNKRRAARGEERLVVEV